MIAGRFGGRRLVMPRDPRVRPTADRVREAWFSILGDRIVGASVVDLYAGSGALGLEALSRGAGTVTFVELNPASLAAIEANVAALGVADQVTIRRRDVSRFVSKLEPGAFDIALADPPYGHDGATALVERFRSVPFAGILAVEHPSDCPLPGGDSRRYGDTMVTLFHAARGV